MVTVTISVIGSLLIADEVVVLRLQLIGAPEAEIEKNKRQARNVDFMLTLMELRDNSWEEQRKEWSKGSSLKGGGRRGWTWTWTWTCPV